MPTDTNDTQQKDPLAVGQSTVNMPAQASAPGADVPTATSGPTTTATDPLAQMPGEPKVEGTEVPGTVPAADVPVVGGANPTDLPPKLPGEGDDTSNQGGVPPVQPGM